MAGALQDQLFTYADYKSKDNQIFTRNYTSPGIVSVDVITGLNILLEKVFAE
jgi:hypothetical protein